MPTTFKDPDPKHNEKDVTSFALLPSMVARQMTMAEVDRIPAARKTMDAEWTKLTNMKCWDPDSVAEYDDVVKQARQSDETVHFGRVFPIAHERITSWPPNLESTRGELFFRETTSRMRTPIKPCSMKWGAQHPC